MTTQKTYTLTTTNKRRTLAELSDEATSQPLYTLDLSFVTQDMLPSKENKHSITMRAATTSPTTTTTPSDSSSPTPSSILGTCIFSLSSWATPIHLCIGDPISSPTTALWEDLRCRSQWETNAFELSLDSGDSSGRKLFVWKRTADIEGQGRVKAKLDWLHLKLVEGESGAVVAGFRHNFLYGRKRGVFWVEGEAGEEWVRVVLLSGVAVLEYLRKMSGWSW
ncbi:hypothetical protein B0J11DRAFT_583493 [Dendryphion nanum]|uniref:Uncharacterized protein n=1 Tax=Dendryphion nanum TaxID=256645 RepID=A0A9P9IEE4_9PLEO|nr:hypothetical protein B0J11DRAFT_583493 [Dendryphion nanum]